MQKGLPSNLAPNNKIPATPLDLHCPAHPPRSRFWRSDVIISHIYGPRVNSLTSKAM